MNAPQGNEEEIAEAQRRLAVAQEKVKEASAAAGTARAAAAEAKNRENAALAREAEAREAEAPFKVLLARCGDVEDGKLVVI